MKGKQEYRMRKDMIYNMCHMLACSQACYMTQTLTG